MIEPKLISEDNYGFINDDHINLSSHLAKRLLNEELCFILGSGISKPVGLLSWNSLVKECCEDKVVGIYDHKLEDNKGEDEYDNNIDKLLDLMDRVRENINNIDNYHQLIKLKLYKRFEEKIRKNASIILKSDPLIAVGTLTTGSVSGKITNIITFNFDNILEWYLGLHGYQVKIIHKYPELLGKADVYIYHPHGYLPFDQAWEKSDFVIFDKESYMKRLNPVNQDKWWRTLENILNSKQAILYGVSINDPAISLMLSAIKNNMRNNKNIERNAVGFWLFKDITNVNEKKRHISKVNQLGCIPIYFRRYKDMAKYLLRIRQIAAGLILS